MAAMAIANDAVNVEQEGLHDPVFDSVTKLEVNRFLYFPRAKFSFIAKFIKGVNGISAKDVKTLQDNGFHTVDSVARVLKKNLLTIKGLSDVKVDKLISEARKLCKSIAVGVSRSEAHTHSYYSAKWLQASL